MTNIRSLDYQGRSIRLRGAMLNLTDLWRAAGGPNNRRPTDWLILDETVRFRAHAHSHWTEANDPAADNAVLDGIIQIDTDRYVATRRGRNGGTWAQWQLALAYARYLSPAFHLWANTVVRAAMERSGGPQVRAKNPVLEHLTQEFQRIHRRFDTVERNDVDILHMILSIQELMFGGRREFTERSRRIILEVVAAEPFGGQCPCCGSAPVLARTGRPMPGAEIDHFVSSKINRPESGWLICGACHMDLTHGGYLVRFARMPEFRTFQAAVFEHLRQLRTRGGDLPE